MKKAYALIILFALLPFSIRAQHHAAQSVSDILSWISTHFEVAKVSTVVTFSSGTVDYADEKFMTGITFEGCRVSITQMENNRYDKVDTGQLDYSLEQTGNATLDLSKGIPDAITADKGSEGQPPAHLIVKFAQPFTWHQEQKYSANPVPQDVVDNFDVSQVVIEFATLDAAKSHAKAWHDAIVGCGGKYAPNKNK
ncbi:MAG: hypothetical protein ABSF16_13630 [Terracidiphilus sp.]|jgi:hypothetical protein